MKNEDIIINYYNVQNKRLNILRKLVKLNPIDYLRVSNAIGKAEELRRVSSKFYPNESIDTDYSIANDLEYTLRLNTFIRKYQTFFVNYQKLENECHSIENIAENFIDRYIEEETLETNKRKVKSTF